LFSLTTKEHKMAKLKVLWTHICSLGVTRQPGEEYEDVREDNVEIRVGLGLVEVIEGGSDAVIEKQIEVAEEVAKRSKKADEAAAKKAEEDAAAAAKKAEEDAAAALLNA
jgi:hypothetical protein